jgi:uncharacterized protein (DUF1501 family)
MTKMAFSRRRLLGLGALALAGASGATLLFGSPAHADSKLPSAKKTLVCLFMRGGVDGLSLIVPHADAAYYRERPSIAIPPPGKSDGALDLDGRFGLHPRLAPLRALYQAGELAVVHAVGSPHATRSHFDAQDYMESGTPGQSSTRDGWLGRCLALRGHAETTPFAAVAFGQHVPRALYGRAGVLGLRDLQRFDLRAPPRIRDRMHGALEAMYAGGDDPLSRRSRDALSAVRTVRALDVRRYQPENGAAYPQAGRTLLEIAALIKANVGLQVAFADVGGWDTHTGQNGRLGHAFDQLGRALLAFRQDLGDRIEDVVLLTMSEFGRTVRENGSGGTDHGHGTAMLLMGGSVRGRKVYGNFPGLEPEQRFEGRDLAVTTDFRDLFAEVAERALGVSELERVFPGYAPSPARFPGMLAG